MIVERALRLLNTTEAFFGVGLAVMMVVVALAMALCRQPQVLFRGRGPVWARSLLVLGVGAVAASGIVSATYDAWYRHRCMDHHSDIPECDSARPSWYDR